MNDLPRILYCLIFALGCPCVNLSWGQLSAELVELQREIEDSWIRLASDIGLQEGHILARNPDRPEPPTRIHFQFMGDFRKLTLDSPRAPKTIFVGNDRSLFRVNPAPGDNSTYLVAEHHDLKAERGVGPKLAMHSRSVWAPVSVDAIRLDQLAKNSIRPKSISELDDEKFRLEYELATNIPSTINVVVNRRNRFGVVEWELNISDEIRRLGRIEYGSSLGGGFPNTVEIRESIKGKDGATISRYELDAPRLCTADKSEFYEEAFGLPKLDVGNSAEAMSRTRFWLLFRIVLLALLLILGASMWYRSNRSKIR